MGSRRCVMGGLGEAGVGQGTTVQRMFDGGLRKRGFA